MVKFKHEKYNPEKVLEKAISSGAQKAKRLILEEKLRITPRIEKRLGSLVSDMENKYNVKIGQEKIKKEALEELMMEKIMLPEKLQEKYADIIATEIVGSLSEKEDFHQSLREKIIELTKQGINIDDQKIEEAIKKLAA